MSEGDGGGLRPYPVDMYYCPECRERKKVVTVMAPDIIALKALLDEHDKRLVAKLRAGAPQ